MNKITPFLWFDNNAEEAMNFYAKIFKNSKIGEIKRWEMDAPGVEKGKVMHATFTLEGQDYMCMDAGPQFKFNESISMYVDCADQAEVDYYWNALLEGGGEESMCGWLKDRFGMSWQIIPKQLGELMSDPDKEKAGRVMQAMLQMKKIDVAKLQEAYNG